MLLPQPSELLISTLGPCRFPSPLLGRGQEFIDDDNCVLVSAETRDLRPFLETKQMPPAFELAGPRSRLFFDAASLSCGIVTCGGICPGLNDVIRSVVLTLTHWYGVQRIWGFRYGFAGLSSKSGYDPLLLTPKEVDSIHEHGGTLLGTSRGPQDIGDMVDTLVRYNVGILFAIGGDGTLRGASALYQEATRRNFPLSVIAIPKTIDNDLEWTERSFGFATAVEEATKALEAAHAEARGAWNGMGLVKLMGRHSGFIAAHATLANADVNFCLVPEVPFTLEGEGGFLQALERRLESRHHAVIVVAEGAGQEFLQSRDNQKRDASGNLRLKDIGVFLRDQIERYFADRHIEATVKYIDPSYIIRSLPANAVDSEFCLVLGQNAVHAGMTGRTAMVVGYWNHHFTHVPIHVAVSRRKQLNPQGEVWQRVLQATGQPAAMVGQRLR